MEQRVIREYNVASFAFAIQDGLDDGFRLSEDSQFYPCIHGYSYEVTMVKEAANTVDGSTTPAVKPKQAGRPAKTR